MPINNNAKVPNRRLDYIDSLRGIAACLVVFQHLASTVAAHADAPLWYRSFIDAINIQYLSPGRIGVVAFFLVSGFVVPFSLKSPKPVVSFVISRFFRLYPAYWLSLGLAIVLFKYFDVAEFSLKTILANATMVQFLAMQPNIVGVYWTLFIELSFYGLCLAWFIIGKIHNPRFISVVSFALLTTALATAVLRYKYPSLPVPVGNILFLAIMHLGILARLSFLEKAPHALSAFSKMTLVFAFLTPLTCWLAYSGTSTDPWISSITGIFMGFAVFIIFISKRGFSGNLYVNLGKVSFSIYLFHDIILQVLSKELVSFSWWNFFVLTSIFTILTTLAISTLIYRFLEIPCIRLSHRLISVIRSRKSSG